MKKKFVICKFILILLIIFASKTVYAKSEVFIKGDIDCDEEVSINDLAKLKLHLIDKEFLTSERPSRAADVDCDADITVNDLAQLKLILLGLKDVVSIEDTSFDGYEFTQITPENRNVTYSRVIMTDREMEEFGSTGAGSQWPISLETSKDR